MITLLTLSFVGVVAFLFLLLLPSGRARPGTSTAHLSQLLALAESRHAPGEDAWPRYVSIRQALDAAVPQVAPGEPGSMEEDPFDRIWSASFEKGPRPADIATLMSANSWVDQIIDASALPRRVAIARPNPTQLPGEPNFAAGGAALSALGFPEASANSRRLLTLLRAEMRVAASERQWERTAHCLAAGLRMLNQT